MQTYQNCIDEKGEALTGAQLFSALNFLTYAIFVFLKFMIHTITSYKTD
jgi:hypothetical protein